MGVLTALGWLVGFAGAWGWRLLKGAVRAAWWVLVRTFWLTLALLVLGFNRGWARWCLVVAMSGRRARGGFGGDSPEKRTPDTVHRPEPAVAANLKPIPAQRIAMASYDAQRYWTHAFDGPELLEMLVGPAGTGKTEVKLGQIRAGFDGEPFCGLPTSRCKRILLLSEMGGATLQPALLRWGFVTVPTGRLDGIRLRYLPPKGYAGGLIDVVYAADVYTPRMVDGVLQETDWATVILAVLDLVKKGRYDRVLIDSLGEWMGSDNNAAMLSTLGACRFLTHAGAGVTVLHHTPRSDPYRPRGGTVIEAKLDIGWSVTGTGDKGKTHSRSDSRRSLNWFKTRFPEHTPPEAMTVERVWDGPESGTRPHYRLVGDSGALGVSQVAAAQIREETRPVLPPPPREPPQQDQVRVALSHLGGAGGTVSDLAKATGLPRQRVDEALKALCGKSLAFERRKITPQTGGKPTACYVATSSLLAGDSGGVRG